MTKVCRPRIYKVYAEEGVRNNAIPRTAKAYCMPFLVFDNLEFSQNSCPYYRKSPRASRLFLLHGGWAKLG